MAKNCSFRLYDAYTRDRSTPQPDTFWGGTDDLKAAVGMEVNGWTYLKWRRRLSTGSSYDHPIVKAPMSLIWAHGQKQGAYTFNVVPSGVNMPGADKNFYANDDLKYHGFTGNRGAASIDFRSKSVSAPTQEFSIGCNNVPGVPNHCTYRMTFAVDKQANAVRFTIATNQENTWVAVGVSDNRNMAQTDVMLGYVNENNVASVTDRWASGYSLPAVDSDQTQIKSFAGSRQNGVTTFNIIRTCTSSDPKDISISGSHYLIFAFGPLVNGGVNKHTIVPTVSQQKFFFHCGDPLPTQKSTTTSSSDGPQELSNNPCLPVPPSTKPPLNPGSTTKPGAGTVGSGNQGGDATRLLASFLTTTTLAIFALFLMN